MSEVSNRRRLSLGSVSRFTMAAALCVPASIYATAASAQDEGNEIVVTAQFREQNVQATPIAITAMSGAQLEERGQSSIVDIAAKAPSVMLSESNAQGPSLIAYIRGIGQADHSPAFEPGVGMYVDDVYLSTLTGSLLDLLDLERVEVLRGPQGTLAGMNSIGGAIKLYSKKPDGNGGGYVELTGGSLNRLDVRAGANFTLVEDKLFARISGVSRNQDGYVKRYDFACTHPDLAKTYNIPTAVPNNRDCLLGTEGGKSYVAARGSLRWIPTDRLDITISGDITRDDSEAKPQTLIYVGRGDTQTYAPGLTGMDAISGPLRLDRYYPMYTTAPVNGLDFWNPVTQTSPFLSYSPWGGAGDTFTSSPYVTYSNYGDVLPADGGAPINYEPKTSFHGWGISGNIQYDVSDNLKFTSITAYRSYEAGWIQDFDMTPLSNAMFSYKSESWQFTQEARLAANLFNDAVDVIVGGFYLNRQTNYQANVNQGLLIFAEYDEVPATSWAAFANASWRITDKLELNAGIRYSEDEKTFRFFRGGRPGIPGIPPYFPCVVDGVDYGLVHVAFCQLNGKEGKFSGSNVDYRGVVQYQWTDDIMTYASVATGYKGGGVNPRPYTANQTVPFDSETLIAYEIGAKTSLFDRRARLNVSAFVNKYSDFIAGVFSRVPVGTDNLSCPFALKDDTCSYIVNAGDATMKGLEVELNLEPVDGLIIDGAASLLDFKYDNLSGCSPVLTPATCTSPSGGLGGGLRYGMQLAHSPMRQFSGGIQYTIDLGNAGRLTPRFDINYQSSYNTDAVNKVLAVVPERTLMNARLAWNSAEDDWQVALQVTNLTDELYYTNVAPQDNSASVAGNPGMPRQWSISVKRNF